MGVSCDKFVGYGIDILNEWNDLSDEEKDRWSSDFKNIRLEQNNAIKFRPYYNKAGSLKDMVTILYDGMSGQYCKLVYVVDYESNAEDENSDNIVDSINTLLKDSAVPFLIKQHLKKVYKTIFGEELNMTSFIKAEYIIHWH